MKLRERLKEAGGKEILSDEEWDAGEFSIARQISAIHLNSY